MDMQDVALHHIIYRTVARFRVPLDEFMGQTRKPDVVEARLAGYWLARELTGAPVFDIARIFDRDHSSIVDGIRSAGRRVKANRDYRAKVTRLLREIKAELEIAEHDFIRSLTMLRHGDAQEKSTGTALRTEENRAASPP